MGKKLTQVKRYNDEKKWEDDVEWFSFPDERMVLVRIVGDTEVLARHWVRTMSGKMFPLWCPRLNTDEEFDHSRPCPAHSDFEDKSQKMLVMNAIIRQLQERGDPNPVKGIMVPHAIMDDLAQIAELIKEDPADPERGVDLAIKYSSKAVGNKKWSVQRGDTTPLTDAERKYRYYPLEKIVPQFDDPEVAKQYARNMKEAMARHKYYVVPEGRVPENARDPFKYFRGDARGQPWTDFPVLVDYRNDEKGESAGTYRVSGRGDSKPLYEREEKERRAPDGEQKEEAHWTDPPDRTEKPAESRQAAPTDGFPEGVGTKQDDRYGEVPECFADYKGVAICSRCSMRARCIETTDDETDL